MKLALNVLIAGVVLAAIGVGLSVDASVKIAAYKLDWSVRPYVLSIAPLMATALFLTRASGMSMGQKGRPKPDRR